MKIKNKLNFILILGIMLVAFLLVASTKVKATDEEIVHFNSKDLKEALISEGYDTNYDNQLSVREMKRIKDLTNLVEYYDTDMSDLTGLEYAINLERIYCTGVKDISPLTNSTKMEKLWIRYSNLENIDVLENFSNLTYLDLSYSKINDISVILKLTNLVELHLVDNNLTDITVLQNLTSLEYLELRENKIQDLTPLINLTNLTFLDLGNNNLIDIGQLKYLTNLESLGLSDNKIENITILSTLRNLISLDLCNNKIKDITSLANLTSLEGLRLSNNIISDIDNLEKLTNLTNLDLNSNCIDDIYIISKLYNLESLDLSNNNITNTSIFDDGDYCTLRNLRYLNLSYNYIDDSNFYRAFWMQHIEYFNSDYQKLIQKCKINNIKNQAYTTKAIEPNLTITCGNIKLKKGIDYEVSFKNNTNIGTATVTIKGIGKFRGTTKQTFKIVLGITRDVVTKAQSTSAIQISWKRDSVVSGYEIYMSTSKSKGYKKIATVKGNSKITYKKTKLTSGKNYYFKVRSYKVINGKNNYGAYSQVLLSTTKPATPKISKLTTKSRKVTINWKKISGSNGYEIYMKQSGGKYIKIKTITKGSIIKYTKNNLSKGKNYYFKVRAYKTVNSGKKVYSSYSTAKKIKVK